MGYEIAGGLGVKMACPDRDVYVMVGDGSYLMMAQELVTAVQESVKLIVVLVQNHGFHSIGSLSESLGSQRFGTRYRYRDAGQWPARRRQAAHRSRSQRREPGRHRVQGLDRRRVPRPAVRAKAVSGPVVVHVETDPLVHAPSSQAWWDVPVAQTASIDTTQQAHKTYVEAKREQRSYLTPSTNV
jgi:3D-(3,5/4)-trihydroxycyclohexane-1,2-dione acylhydrolase (decyclizing)